MRKDYDLKMAIINEINEEKRIRQEYLEGLKEIERKEHGDEIREQAKEFK